MPWDVIYQNYSQLLYQTNTAELVSTVRNFATFTVICTCLFFRQVEVFSTVWIHQAELFSTVRNDATFTVMHLFILPSGGSLFYSAE